MAEAPYPYGGSTRTGIRKRPPIALLGASVALAALLVSARPLAISGIASGAGRPVGAVYVASNSYSGNQILAFPRYADGSLGPVAPGVPTGGLGSGPGLLLPDDPLGAQSPLIVDQQDGLLFVVNAGSDDVSAFSIHGSTLTLADREPSDGAYPVSLALFDHTLYVLSAAGNSITGFHVASGGRLTMIQTCQLPALPPGADGMLAGGSGSSAQPVMVQTPGQVGFSPDGTKLLVVSKEGSLLTPEFPFSTTLGAGRIYVYDARGTQHTLLNCGKPATTVLLSNSDGNGKMPFSFGWTAQGQLVLLEVFGATTSFGGGAVSSFTLHGDGSLTPISTSVPDGETAPCWIVRSGTNLYVANNVSNSPSQPNAISRYVVNGKGELTSTATVAATINSSLVDMAVTKDARFIYQLAPGLAQVWPFSVASNGALSGLTPVSDGEPGHSGQVGMATFDF